MGALNDFVGAVGGTILGIELIVIVLILLAINAGLAFLLYLALKRMGWVHQKREWLLGKVNGLVDRGAGDVAAPVILTTSGWRGLKAGIYRATHWPRRQAEPEAALPVAVTTSAPKRTPRRPSHAA